MTTMEFNLTRDQLEKARTALAAQDVHLTGDKGDISSKGVQITYDYTEPKLTIVIVDGGGYPMFLVKHKINDWFKGL